MRKIILLVLMMLLSVNVVFAEPQIYINDADFSEYGCEHNAKAIQAKYGGDILYVAPINKDGAWVLGEYSGHFANRVYLKEYGIVYVDYSLQSIYNSSNELKDYWLDVNWYNNGEIFNLGAGEHPPFGLIWHE